MNSMASLSSNTTEAVTERSLSVRFEDACILIPPPGPAKSVLRPRIITKSYSLPLWKTSSSSKKAVSFQSLVSELNGEVSPEGERKAFSLTVSLPSLTTKSRPRRSSITPTSPSCLSKRNPSFSPSSNSCIPSSSSSPTSSSTVLTSVSSPPPLHRAPYFPPIQPATTFKQAETIPLRPCCEACYSRVDAALAQGESWPTQWSQGAVRRYSEGEHVHLHAQYSSLYDVTRVWSPKGVGDDPDGGDMPLEDVLTIDEVDVKRRSGDYSHASLNNHLVPPSSTEDADSDDEDVSHQSTDISLDPPFITAHFQEEDEDMLFPLPSPRRTPNQSPIPTPTGSQVNLSSLHSGSQTSVGLSGSQITLTVPAVSSPLASQSAEPLTPLPYPRPTARSPPVAASQMEPAPNQPPPRSLSSSPVYRRQQASSSETRRVQQPRRSSFSTASETFLKGSTSVLKSVAAGMKAGAVGIIH